MSMHVRIFCNCSSALTRAMDILQARPSLPMFYAVLPAVLMHTCRKEMTKCEPFDSGDRHGPQEAAAA